MYTNINCDLAIECVQNRWDEIKAHCSIPMTEFLYMLKICITSTIFQFEEDYYQQIQGLSMGNSVAAVLGELVMEDFEVSLHKESLFIMLIYRRFVDDVFLLVHENDIYDLYSVFNSWCPCIQFTLELEQNNCLNFLDMTVVCDENKLFCKWYGKPTASGRYLNYLSVQPQIYKRNVVVNLARRINGLSDER